MGYYTAGTQRTPPERNPFEGTGYMNAPMSLVAWDEDAEIALYRHDDNQGHCILCREPWRAEEYEYTNQLQSWRAYGEEERKNSETLFWMLAQYINEDPDRRAGVLGTFYIVMQPGHPHSSSPMRPTAWFVELMASAMEDFYGRYVPGVYCLSKLHGHYDDIKKYGKHIGKSRRSVTQDGDWYTLYLDGIPVKEGADQYTKEAAIQWDFASAMEYDGVAWVAVWNYRGTSLFAYLRVADELEVLV